MQKVSKNFKIVVTVVIIAACYHYVDIGFWSVIWNIITAKNNCNNCGI